MSAQEPHASSFICQNGNHVFLARDVCQCGQKKLVECVCATCGDRHEKEVDR